MQVEGGLWREEGPDSHSIWTRGGEWGVKFVGRVVETEKTDGFHFPHQE